MKNKNIYRPNPLPSYKKGGKNKVYTDKDFKKGERGHFGIWDTLTDLFGDVGTLIGINQQETWLEQMQEQYGSLPTAVTTGMDAYSGALGSYESQLGAGQNLKDFAEDIPGLVQRQKPVSKEFAEGQQDVLERQTGAAITQAGKGGNPTGIKGILDSATQGQLAIGEKVAGMEMQENQQETDRQKFLASLQGQTETSISQQDASGAETAFGGAANTFGDITSAWGSLQGSILAAESQIVGTEAQAWGDLLGSIAQAIGEAVPFEKGGKLKKYDRGGEMVELMESRAAEGEKKTKEESSSNYNKGGAIKSYNEGGEESEMMPAGEPDVTPGEFSHEKNPIDIVQKRDNGQDEKIGEMTGGEGIMPPNDVAEFEEMLADNDKIGVFNKLKELFEFWDEKSEEHEEKEIRQAKGGAKMGYRPMANINY